MKRAIAICALVILSFFITSAIEPNGAQLSGKPVYFYPKANVYFDTGNALYTFFSEEGWKQAGNLPEELKTDLGTKAMIQHPANPVWAANNEDRMVYSIALYSAGAQLAEKYRTDYLASLPPKPVVKEEPKKERSGLRKFFDKIFGKKEKEASVN